MLFKFILRLVKQKKHFKRHKFMDEVKNDNPALEALHFNLKVNEHLDGKVRNLLDRMQTISNQYNDVATLAAEFNIRANFDADKSATYLDFEKTEFQPIIDNLHNQGILKGEKKYKFETKQEIERFKAHLEGQAAILKNKNQEPLLLIQPLLNLLELMNRIAKSFADQDEALKRKTNTF